MFGGMKKGSGRRPGAQAGDTSCREDYLLIPGGRSSRGEGGKVESHDRCLRPTLTWLGTAGASSMPRVGRPREHLCLPR